MRKLARVAVLVLVVGCSQTAGSSSPAARLQEYIDGWNQMGMWLPDQEQVALFHRCLPESQKLLVTALKSPSYEVRMRAAYVIESVGPDARGLGPALIERLRDEPDRLVRLYIYAGLRNVRFDEPQSIDVLKQRFALLDDTDLNPELGESKSNYLAADEKIKVAAALFVLDNGPDKKEHLAYILKWLRVPEGKQTARERQALWERRWGAVLALENMPDASEAIPLLKALQSEKDAPNWVSIHAARVLNSLK